MPSFGRHLLSVCHVPKDRGQLWEQGAQKGELMGYASSLARKQGQCDDGGWSSGRRDTARWPSRSCGRAGSVEHPQVRVVSSVVPEPWRLGDRVTLAPFPGRLRTRGGAEVPGPLSGFRLSALRARDGLPSSRFIVSLHAASPLPLKSPALRSAGLNPNSFQIK